MERKTILISGSTDGIGLQTAEDLLKLGFKVIIHGRNETRVLATKERLIRQTGKEENIETVWGDLASFAEVKKLADSINEKFPKLDVLINNAGVFLPFLKLTEDGFEATFQINHLSHFLLTLLLLKKFPEGEGRIINVSSMAHSSMPIDYENLKGEKHYDPYDAYARSKLANILFTFKLARELTEKGITVNALHPGVISTKLLAAGWGAFGVSVRKGAETSVFLTSSEEVKGVTGKYFVDRREARPAEISYDITEQEKLWDFSFQAVGLDRNIWNY